MIKKTHYKNNFKSSFFCFLDLDFNLKKKIQEKISFVSNEARNNSFDNISGKIQI